MQQDYDSSASGYLKDLFEGIGRQFTDVEILSTSEVNVVAKAKRYGRWWLLKGLRKEVADEAGYQQRLRKELEMLMQLQHPGVVMAVGLEDVEELGICIVMEYVDGITLKEWLRHKRSSQQKCHVVMELCETVGYIHSKGIVHRDLKPENIMITQNGQSVKLIDFGLADTDSYAMLKQPAGTPRYMSPEQAQTAVADVRNDIYSLGVIFSQMDLDYGFRHIIKRCKKPIDKRYQTIDSLTNDIRKGAQLKKLLVIVCVILIFIGLSALSVPHLLINEQIQGNTERQNVEDAITRGKAEIEIVMKNTGIKQHLDTLSNIIYFRPDIFSRLNDGETATRQYTDRIRNDYTDGEIAEISNALTFYYSGIQKQYVEQYNRIKEEYDK